MTARTAVAAVLAAATALALCAACTPRTGTVTGRDYGTGQARYCYQAYREWPETWSLKVDDGERTGWRTVSESEYAACLPGDRYPDCARSQR